MSWQIRYVRELKFVDHTVLLLWPVPRQPPHPFPVFCSYQTFPTWKNTLKKRSSDLMFFTSCMNEIIMAKGRFDWFQLSLEPLWRDQDNVHKNQTHVPVNNCTWDLMYTYVYMCSIYTSTSIHTLISKYMRVTFFCTFTNQNTSKHHKLNEFQIVLPVTKSVIQLNLLKKIIFFSLN